MASLQTKVDAVKTAVASPSTCTPTTVAQLKQLLLSETDDEAAKPAAKTTRAPKTPAKSRSKSTATPNVLSPKERTTLATHVVNVTLKALTEVAKAPAAPPPPAEKQSDPEEADQSQPRSRTLRRSLSAPLSPIQARSLNRVATSPNANSKSTKPNASSSNHAKCAATAECARAAFACLRAAKGSVDADQDDFQVETGMSALVAKLLALGLNDYALKELAALKARLEKTGKGMKSVDETPQNICSLLSYQGIISPKVLSLVATSQIQVLKIIATNKKPAAIEGALPFLRESHQYSPLDVLSRLAKTSEANASKAARQLASLSQLVLSLAPSISSSEDRNATEPRLSVSPTVAFELQSLAFTTQLVWWKLAGHKGKIDEELLSPYSRCVKCFIRRQQPNDPDTYDLLATSFNGMMAMVKSTSYKPSDTSDSPLVSIYQAMGSAAHTTRRYDAAYDWFVKLRKILDSEKDSPVRVCSILARLLAVTLKKEDANLEDATLVKQVTEGLDGCLSGTSADLNELLEALSSTRRAVVGVLRESFEGKASVSSDYEELLKVFIRRYPRFIRRWMGSPPDKEAPAKSILQFDQRRSIVMGSINQVLDATLMVARMDIKPDTFALQDLDDVLQHCTGLLTAVSSLSQSAARTEQLAGYHVKISTLYFAAFDKLRKQKPESKAEKKQLLVALQRSIDAVKDRSAAEKEKAQLSLKLEILAEMCKSSGRGEDTVRTLRSICTNMVEEGVLAKVAASLASQSPRLAWNMNEKTLALSRTLRSIAKADDSLNDWMFLLPEAERAAVLEHLLHLRSEDASGSTPLRLRDARMTAMLRIYTPDKYPIRRFRVLLKLCVEQMGRHEDKDDVATMLDQALRYMQKKELGEDASLAQFIPHLRTYHTSVTALGDPDSLPTSQLKETVSSWAAIAKSCHSKDDVFANIDDPDALLEHLLAINQLAGLRGETHLQLTVLELAIDLAKVLSGPTGDDLILYHCHLATQQVTIGSYTKASETLEKTKGLLQQNKEASAKVMMDFHLTEAEYLAGVDDTTEAISSLEKAHAIQTAGAWAPSKSQASLSLAQVSLVQSMISLQTGDVQEALRSVRTGVKLLSHDWAKLETARSEPSLADTVLGKTDQSRSQVFGPQLWALAAPLFRSLMHISSVYAHVGLYQETLYYAESAVKIAESTQSSMFQAQGAAWMASVYFKAGIFDKVLPKLELLDEHLPSEHCSARIQLARQAGEIYSDMGDAEKATRFLQMAEETANVLGQASADGVAEASEKPAPKKRAAASRVPVKTKVTRAKVATTARVQKRAPAKPKAKQPAMDTMALIKDPHHASLMASVVLTKALGFIMQEDWTSVASVLEIANALPKFTDVKRQEQLIMASKYIGMSAEEMAQDPVFSIMDESTISYPSVSALSARQTNTDKANGQSPPRKGRAGAGRGANQKSLPSFAKALKQAQEVLLEAHVSASASGDSAMLYRISTFLQSTGISLTAASASNSAAVQDNLTTVAIELARNSTWKREQLAIDHAVVPAEAMKLEAMDLTADIASFQSEFIDLVPNNWSVISITLGENHRDLCLTKFRAGDSPFILRLPLERANSRDADSDVFNFDQGHTELRDIIKKANETSHTASGLSTKEQKKAWWAEREALDTRLKELLLAIETTWLGGFKGMFSQHEKHPDLLARFSNSFYQMLDRNLPSRATVRGKKPAKTPNITLDPRILDLFIGLGDPTEPDLDFDEALNDLLYFVVDILQFNGERNAYDEIDFDAMVVETYDALRAYCQSVKACYQQEGAHTILVLDKSLHAFPWESMPCMDGLAVSRVPSLACLRRLILESTPTGSGDEALPKGHYVSSAKGTYMLNPSSDLKNTQSYFEPTFKTLSSWQSVVNKAPQESDFETALTESEILLYFGHGGGGQYVRAKTIRRLEKCRPATFLMGCSSAALTDAGEFSSYGLVWNYLTAGCPAVVGTLWDVTDRDIDRFAGKTFEGWGLFGKGTFKDRDRKGKAVDDGVEADGDDDEAVEERPGSLAEAVARAKGVCRFRYLNAASVVMYGIPVYIERDAA